MGHGWTSSGHSPHQTSMGQFEGLPWERALQLRQTSMEWLYLWEQETITGQHESHQLFGKPVWKIPEALVNPKPNWTRLTLNESLALAWWTNLNWFTLESEGATKIQSQTVSSECVEGNKKWKAAESTIDTIYFVLNWTKHGNSCLKIPRVWERQTNYKKQYKCGKSYESVITQHWSAWIWIYHSPFAHAFDPAIIWMSPNAFLKTVTCFQWIYGRWQPWRLVCWIIHAGLLVSP